MSIPPVNATATTVRRSSWQPPPDGWVKLNVDGSVKGDPPSSAIGGVARDPTSNWIAGFSTHVGLCSVLEAELKALRDGLSLIWILSYLKVLVQSDSATTVKLILSEKELFHPLGMIIADCQTMLQKSWEIELSHTLREKLTWLLMHWQNLDMIVGQENDFGQLLQVSSYNWWI
ncbi:unnamed protein product [Linum tenue]|uniref:RNase H type-1 domain-containing protein n=1 Tax=Linum tenue TaxID=586396 RepID=A0AAV0PG65_9ROSI|nr:unnamed protein product [Linum tenue]